MKKLAALTMALTLAAAPAVAGEYDDRLSTLETTVEKLVDALDEKNKDLAEMEERMTAASSTGDSTGDSGASTLSNAFSKFSFGGYGEVHANIVEGDDANGDSNDQFDIHRFVAYIGYDFADWIKFTSEIEIEHAMVSSGDSGELELEQAYLDFLLADYANIRVGRTLVPVGRLNQVHEPTTFNGVERPNFYKYVIPTTWWSDGAGLFGSVGDVSYQLAFLGGLDGSEISSSGIRGSRLKERPSLNDPAYVIRLDYTPFAERDLQMRVGASHYYSGLNNGNKGDDPDLVADLSICEADFDFSYKNLDLAGAVALEKINNAENLAAGVAEEIFGYYLEAAYHVFPDSWRTGKLSKADAALFVRYDEYDTQYDMPTGVLADPSKDRHDWTMGITFHPTPNVVVKADYQVLKSEADTDPDNTINFGIGWQF